jgi:hypothetical protein
MGEWISSSGIGQAPHHTISPVDHNKPITRAPREEWDIYKIALKQNGKNQTLSNLITNQQPEKVAMASSTTETTTIIAEQTRPADNNHKAPLKLKGVLDQFKSFDVTPVIGKEFPEVNLKSLLRAENSDELIRDLAITSKLTQET